MHWSVKKIIGIVALACLITGSGAMAAPVEVGPPPMEEGRPVRMAVVKKYGRIWYPAPLVGFYRGMTFAYDHVTGTVYVDGQRSEMKSVVVDGIVYIPVKPVATGSDINVTEAHQATREGLYHQFPEQRDNPVLTATGTAHPWAKVEQPVGPVINLEPTGHTHVPAHMRPGAAPPQQAPEKLPGRLPRPGQEPLVNPSATREPTVQIAPSHGIPRHVTAQGGQPEGHRVEPTQPKAMQPVPYKKPTQPKAETEAAMTSNAAFSPRRAENKVFGLSMGGGDLVRNSKDSLLTLKLEQKNLSPVAQSNLGSFAVRCKDGTRVEPVRSRSYLPNKALAPGQSRQGELVFRLSREAVPESLELEGSLPLSVPLSP